MSAPERIPSSTLSACADPKNELSLSIASIWEIQIKHQLDKLVLDLPLEEILHQQQDENNLQLLSIELPHILALNQFPLHHRDPFDRLLIAQAATEDMHLVSNDKLFRRYDVKLLW